MVKVAYPAVTSGGSSLALTYGASVNSYSGFDPTSRLGRYARASRFGRVVDQKWQNQSGTPTVNDRFKYAYDPTSRLSRYARASRTSNRLYRTNEVAANHAFDELYHANGPSGQYDGLDRLTGFRRGTLTDTDSDGVLDTVADNSTSQRQQWTLDAVGNWGAFKQDAGDGGTWDLEQTRDHNKANEIEDSGQTPNAISGTPDWVDPAYDAAGNMTAGPQPGYETADANTQLYKYDAWNRLTKIYRDADADDLIDDPGELVATYSYDGQNRRIRKVVENGESDITYDYYYNENWQVLEVRKGEDPDAYQQYVWGIQYVDAPVVSFLDGNLDGDVADVGTDSTLYYTYDGNFNVTAVIKPDGTVAERYTYDPYGKVTFKAADWSDAASQSKSAYDNEILYCGYRFDPESGNHLARRRYLTPPLGRWLTTDPIVYGDGMIASATMWRTALMALRGFGQAGENGQYQDGMNLYQYVKGTPLTGRDPSGLLCCGCPPAPPGTLPFLGGACPTLGLTKTVISPWSPCTPLWFLSTPPPPYTIPNIAVGYCLVVSCRWRQDYLCVAFMGMGNMWASVTPAGAFAPPYQTRWDKCLYLVN